jgi:hypothetical protein
VSVPAHDDPLRNEGLLGSETVYCGVFCEIRWAEDHDDVALVNTAAASPARRLVRRNRALRPVSAV